MISDAISLQRVSKIVGYKLTTGNFIEESPNLPQRVMVLGEANDANQSNLSLDPYEIASAQEAGERYGFGSPIHIQARILRPVSGGGLEGIPVIVYPQAAAVGATAKILEIVPTGTATGNGVHTLVIAGRDGIDGTYYNINIVAGDTPDDIADKISDAINSVLSSPCTGTSDPYSANLTSKWKGLTADGLNVIVNDYGTPLGITYTVNSIQSGSGTPSVQAALEKIQNNWVTFVCNPYTDTQTMTTLENFNGFPDPNNPTGRYRATVQKPFVAITGSVAEDPSSVTDARLNQNTIALAPAPLSTGLAMEAAANRTVRAAVIAQNTPHLDISGQTDPDMPTPAAIGKMSSYDDRDIIVKKGCSTVDLVAGEYKNQDFVTTYHKLGENPPQFRYVRNLVIDWNVRYGYFLLEETYVADHAIAADGDIVTVAKVIKPKEWKAILFKYADDLAKRGLIVDAEFMKKSIRVSLSTSNPDRLETFFRYKRSGFVRQASTTAEAGFNFGKTE
jgi:phage tail sheath gpL-like